MLFDSLPDIDDTLAVMLISKLECFFSDWLPISPVPFRSKGEKYLAIRRGPTVLVSKV